MISGDGVSEEVLSRFLLEAQENFLGHDIKALKARFVLPFIVYSAAGVLLIKDEAEFLDHASRYLQELRADDIEMSECQIKDIAIVSDQRFHATVRWMDFGDEGQICSSSLIRYFMIEEAEGHWKIEMMEFVEMPISISQAERVIH